jgi:hypothetical protein
LIAGLMAILEKKYPMGRFFNGLVCLFLLYMNFTNMYHNVDKPLRGTKNIWNTSRNEGYFLLRSEMYETYKKAAEIIAQNNYQKVALVLATNDTWEYPLWMYLKQQNPKIIIQNVQIGNNISKIKEKPFKYDILLRINNEKNTITFEKP